MKYIKQFFVWLYHNLKFKDYVIIGLVMLCIGFSISTNYYRNKSHHPVIIYNNEQVELYKNKLNDEYKLKNVYVQTIDQLKTGNSILAAEVKRLKDNPVVVTQEVIKFRIDTVYAESEKIEYGDSLNNLYWHVQDPNDYFSLSGNTFVKHDFSEFKTRINDLTVNTDLNIDIIEKDKKLSVIGRATNPYVQITNLDGVMIDPTQSKVLKQYYKQKKWNIGPYVGYGITGDGKLRPSLGISISYGLIQF